MSLKEEILDTVPRWKERWLSGEGVIKLARTELLYEGEAGQHVHEHPELFLQLEGSNHFTVPGQQIRVNKGEALLVPAGVPHAERARHGRDAAFRMFVFGLTPQWLTYIKGCKGKLPFPMIESVIHSPNPSPRALGELISAATRLLSEPSGRNLGTSVMCSILDFVTEGVERGPREGFLDESDFSSRVLALLRSHYMQADCNVAQLARELDMSPNHLSARFRKETGMRLGDLIVEERLEHSCRLLGKESMPVADVAQRCGFRDASYFIRCFRKAYGVTPLLYRKRSRKEVEASH